MESAVLGIIIDSSVAIEAERERRRVFLDELKAAVPVYSITDVTAELVGRIGAESAAKGLKIPRWSGDMR